MSKSKKVLLSSSAVVSTIALSGAMLSATTSEDNATLEAARQRVLDYLPNAGLGDKEETFAAKIREDKVENFTNGGKKWFDAVNAYASLANEAQQLINKIDDATTTQTNIKSNSEVSAIFDGSADVKLLEALNKKFASENAKTSFSAKTSEIKQSLQTLAPEFNTDDQGNVSYSNNDANQQLVSKAQNDYQSASLTLDGLSTLKSALEVVKNSDLSDDIKGFLNLVLANAQNLETLNSSLETAKLYITALDNANQAYQDYAKVRSEDKYKTLRDSSTQDKYSAFNGLLSQLGSLATADQTFNARSYPSQSIEQVNSEVDKLSAKTSAVVKAFATLDGDKQKAKNDINALDLEQSKKDEYLQKVQQIATNTLLTYDANQETLNSIVKEATEFSQSYLNSLKQELQKQIDNIRSLTSEKEEFLKPYVEKLASQTVSGSDLKIAVDELTKVFYETKLQQALDKASKVENQSASLSQAVASVQATLQNLNDVYKTEGAVDQVLANFEQAYNKNNLELAVEKAEASAKLADQKVDTLEENSDVKAKLSTALETFKQNITEAKEALSQEGATEEQLNQKADQLNLANAVYGAKQDIELVVKQTNLSQDPVSSQVSQGLANLEQLLSSSNSVQEIEKADQDLVLLSEKNLLLYAVESIEKVQTRNTTLEEALGFAKQRLNEQTRVLSQWRAWGKEALNTLNTYNSQVNKSKQRLLNLISVAQDTVNSDKSKEFLTAKITEANEVANKENQSPEDYQNAYFSLFVAIAKDALVQKVYEANQVADLQAETKEAINEASQVIEVADSEISPKMVSDAIAKIDSALVKNALYVLIHASHDKTNPYLERELYFARELAKKDAVTEAEILVITARITDAEAKQPLYDALEDAYDVVNKSNNLKQNITNATDYLANPQRATRSAEDYQNAAKSLQRAIKLNEAYLELANKQNSEHFGLHLYKAVTEAQNKLADLTNTDENLANDVIASLVLAENQDIISNGIDRVNQDQLAAKALQNELQQANEALEDTNLDNQKATEIASMLQNALTNYALSRSSAYKQLQDTYLANVQYQWNSAAKLVLDEAKKMLDDSNSYEASDFEKATQAIEQVVIKIKLQQAITNANNQATLDKGLSSQLSQVMASAANSTDESVENLNNIISQIQTATAKNSLNLALDKALAIENKNPLLVQEIATSQALLAKDGQNYSKQALALELQISRTNLVNAINLASIWVIENNDQNYYANSDLKSVIDFAYNEQYELFLENVKRYTAPSRETIQYYDQLTTNVKLAVLKAKLQTALKVASTAYGLNHLDEVKQNAKNLLTTFNSEMLEDSQKAAQIQKATDDIFKVLATQELQQLSDTIDKEENSLPENVTSLNNEAKQLLNNVLEDSTKTQDFLSKAKELLTAYTNFLKENNLLKDKKAVTINYFNTLIYKHSASDLTKLVNEINASQDAKSDKLNTELQNAQQLLTKQDATIEEIATQYNNLQKALLRNEVNNIIKDGQEHNAWIHKTPTSLKDRAQTIVNDENASVSDLTKALAYTKYYLEDNKVNVLDKSLDQVEKISPASSELKTWQTKASELLYSIPYYAMAKSLNSSSDLLITRALYEAINDAAPSLKLNDLQIQLDAYNQELKSQAINSTLTDLFNSLVTKANEYVANPNQPSVEEVQTLANQIKSALLVNELANSVSQANILVISDALQTAIDASTQLVNSQKEAILNNQDFAASDTKVENQTTELKYAIASNRLALVLQKVATLPKLATALDAENKKAQTTYENKALTQNDYTVASEELLSAYNAELEAKSEAMEQLQSLISEADPLANKTDELSKQLQSAKELSKDATSEEVNTQISDLEKAILRSKMTNNVTVANQLSAQSSNLRKAVTEAQNALQNAESNTTALQEAHKTLVQELQQNKLKTAIEKAQHAQSQITKDLARDIQRAQNVLQSSQVINDWNKAADNLNLVVDKELLRNLVTKANEIANPTPKLQLQIDLATLYLYEVPTKATHVSEALKDLDKAMLAEDLQKAINKAKLYLSVDAKNDEEQAKKDSVAKELTLAEAIYNNEQTLSAAWYNYEAQKLNNLLDGKEEQTNLASELQTIVDNAKKYIENPTQEQQQAIQDIQQAITNNQITSEIVAKANDLQRQTNIARMAKLLTQLQGYEDYLPNALPKLESDFNAYANGYTDDYQTTYNQLQNAINLLDYISKWNNYKNNIVVPNPSVDSVFNASKGIDSISGDKLVLNSSDELTNETISKWTSALENQAQAALLQLAVDQVQTIAKKSNDLQTALNEVNNVLDQYKHASDSEHNLDAQMPATVQELQDLEAKLSTKAENNAYMTNVELLQSVKPYIDEAIDAKAKELETKVNTNLDKALKQVSGQKVENAPSADDLYNLANEVVTMISSQKEELKTLVVSANEIQSKSMDLTPAINRARLVLNDINATSAEITKAQSQLQDAVNKNVLTETINIAMELEDRSDFLESKLNEALDVYKNSSATPEQIKVALENLLKALSGQTVGDKFAKLSFNHLNKGQKAALINEAYQGEKSFDDLNKEATDLNQAMSKLKDTIANKQIDKDNLKHLSAKSLAEYKQNLADSQELVKADSETNATLDDVKAKAEAFDKFNDEASKNKAKAIKNRKYMIWTLATLPFIVLGAAIYSLGLVRAKNKRNK
ncbi:hypothetical protein [Mycoplasma sp. 4044]